MTEYTINVEGNFDPDSVNKVLKELRQHYTFTPSTEDVFNIYHTNNTNEFVGEFVGTPPSPYDKGTTTNKTNSDDQVKPSEPLLTEGSGEKTAWDDVFKEVEEVRDFSDATEFLSLIEGVADIHKVLAKVTRAAYNGNGVKFSPEQVQALFKMIMAPYEGQEHILHDYLQNVHDTFTARDFDLDASY